MNQVNVTGWLTRDPEVKATPRGKVFCNLTLAVKSNFKKDETGFYTIECWERIAEICEKYLEKGSQIGVTGELVQYRWEGSEGSKKSKISIRAKQIDFLSRAKESNNEYQDTQEDVLLKMDGDLEGFEIEDENLPF